ncbi:hypothetical protein BDQ12DRAFT_728092 [Crucibulum laeve]|uniref:Uncharacterized protein n=1 Tax=Crucibulum laeve TaxID=68775 RepID=A0A5C3LIZ0_9AGAR|nr:hypothetical protein BDQ12DRAFT_728092 [Crucibulum laeve]
MLEAEELSSLCGQALQYENFNLSQATEKTVAWAGQIGASYIASSLAYNGWAALADTEDPIYVTTYGNPATCYHPMYSLAFLPLAVTFLIIFFWGLVMLLSSSFSQTSMKRWHYGGLQPLVDVLGLNLEEKDSMILELKEHPSMRLEIWGNKCGNIDGANGTSESSSLVQCSQCGHISRNDK